MWSSYSILTGQRCLPISYVNFYKNFFLLRKLSFTTWKLNLLPSFLVPYEIMIFYHIYNGIFFSSVLLHPSTVWVVWKAYKVQTTQKLISSFFNKFLFIFSTDVCVGDVKLVCQYRRLITEQNKEENNFYKQFFGEKCNNFFIILI